MSKHKADHREPSNGARLKHFLAIERGTGESVWRAVWRRHFGRVAGNRRLVEYVRIARVRTE